MQLKIQLQIWILSCWICNLIFSDFWGVEWFWLNQFVTSLVCASTFNFHIWSLSSLIYNLFNKDFLMGFMNWNSCFLSNIDEGIVSILTIEMCCLSRGKLGSFTDSMVVPDKAVLSLTLINSYFMEYLVLGKNYLYLHKLEVAPIPLPS